MRHQQPHHALRRTLIAVSSAIATIAALLVLDSTTAPSATAATCKPYTFVGIPGSKQGINHNRDNIYGQQVYEVLFWFFDREFGGGYAPAPSSQASSKARVFAVNYPATDPLAGPLDYAESVTQGIKEATRIVKDVYGQCGTSTKFVIAGYSQGAQIATNLVHNWPVPLSRLYKVGLMGNPFYNKDSAASVPVKLEVSSNTPRQAVGPGLLGEEDWPADRVSKIRDVCIQYDLVCNRGGASRMIHEDGYQQVLAAAYDYEHKRWIYTNYPGHPNDHVGRVLGAWFAL